MKVVLAISAVMMRSPNFRATGLFGGNCSFRLTIADCEPAVERPSSQSAVSMTRRNSATSTLPRISGMQTSIRPPPLELGCCDQRHRASGRDLNERHAALIESVIIGSVEE